MHTCIYLDMNLLTCTVDVCVDMTHTVLFICTVHVKYYKSVGFKQFSLPLPSDPCSNSISSSLPIGIQIHITLILCLTGKYFPFLMAPLEQVQYFQCVLEALEKAYCNVCRRDMESCQPEKISGGVNGIPLSHSTPVMKNSGGMLQCDWNLEFHSKKNLQWNVAFPLILYILYMQQTVIWVGVPE